MLIGFCIEDKRRLLVYEFICNGSMDSHLYGNLFGIGIGNINPVYAISVLDYFCT
jgi:hypothetical protein